MKIPIIRKGEYDIWSMRMRQYICHTDHKLWDVIFNGDLEEEPAPTTRETSAPPAPKTAKQLAAKRNRERVKSILLLAIPDEYPLKFHNVADAKSLWEAIKSSFGGLQVPTLLLRIWLFSPLKILMDGDDLEELDLPMAGCSTVTSIRAFARECISGRSQGRRSYGNNGRSNAPTNESSSHALVAQDGLGAYDWSMDLEVEQSTMELLNPNSCISFVGLDEYAIRNKIIESQTTELNNKTDQEAHVHLSRGLTTQTRPFDTKGDFKNKKFKLLGLKTPNSAGKRAVVNTGKGKLNTDLKKSRWVWRPKRNYLDHVAKKTVDHSCSRRLRQSRDLITGSCSGKQQKASSNAKLDRIIRKPLELLHMDLFGPVSVKSINKKRNGLLKLYWGKVFQDKPLKEEKRRRSQDYITALKDEKARVEAIQEELLQFKIQQSLRYLWIWPFERRQEEGIDYDEVFAPVARIEAIRLRAVCSSSSRPLLKPAYFTDKVYKVAFKALYGSTLKLLELVYVDDIIFGSTKKSMCTEILRVMTKRFKRVSMGKLTFFLGLQIFRERQQPNGNLH
ncbi:ribonuclease H-like domain-containing protein [Tanacetum coccineum]